MDARVLLVASLWLIAAGQTTRDSTVAADIVFRGGTVYTADDDRPRAQAVAVRSGRIVYVGDLRGVRRLVDASTRVVDLAGGILLPGFHDSHTHVAAGGLRLADCDVSQDASVAALTAHIAACARERSTAAWVTGGGWQLGLFPNANPTRQQLDAVVPDRPAYFAGADGHSVWVNSRALTAGGITAATPDPPGGRIERDADNGEPSGTLRDSAAGLIRRVMPGRTQADIEAGILRAVALAHQFGITSVHEANAPKIMLAAYRALDRRTALHVRVTAAAPLSPMLNAATDIPAEITRLERLHDEYQYPRLTVTAVKVGADGVLESRTAALLEPYVGTTDRGSTMLPPDLFTALVVALDRAKLPVHVHAIGDRATRLALDAVAAARKANGAHGPMHQIAHLQLVNAADIGRFRPLRVAANIQGLWAQRDPESVALVEPIVGVDRFNRSYPYGRLARAGALLVGGSDWSVTSMNPLLAIQVAATGRAPTAASGSPWQPDNLVSLDAMLKAYTIHGARVQLHEREVGSITVGKAADLVVLDRDLTAISPIDIHRAQVRYTFFDGRQVYPTPTSR